MTRSAGADRAEAMGRRIERTARRLGIPDDDRADIGRAFRAAAEPRRARIADDHHPDYLHHARTALILMDDCGVADPHTLITALFLESRDPSLAAPPDLIERISEDAARSLDRIPVPRTSGDRLLEALLALTPADAMVASAERLDHARHLHLRPREEWEGYHTLTCSAYAPVAARTHPRLGERLSWWCSIFQRRFLDA